MCNLGAVALVDCTVAECCRGQEAVKPFTSNELMLDSNGMEQRLRGFRFMKKVAIEGSRVQPNV